MEGHKRHTVSPSLSRSALPTLNAQFNAFLQLSEHDLLLIRSYQDALTSGASGFSREFYDFLTHFTATHGILEKFGGEGGDLAALAEKQQQHFTGLLSGDISDTSAEILLRIGELHLRRNIEPAWVMGSYRLYFERLQTLIDSAPDIATADRKPLAVALSKLLFRDMGLMLEGYWCAATDAAQQQRDTISRLQEQVTSLLANIPQVLWSVDVITNTPLYVSPNTRNISPHEIEMPIPCLQWTLPEDRARVEDAWQQALSGKQISVESRLLDAAGELRWFRRTFHPFCDSRNTVLRIDGIMEEITTMRNTLDHLVHLATTDTLTGLSNRTLWQDRLSQAITQARRNGEQEVVVMMVDLNHFKAINDTLGHGAGDDVLKQAAQRLAGNLREADTLARLGGDEFGILLICRKGEAFVAAESVAQKVTRCLVEPIPHNDQLFHIGAAIGIAIYPDHGTDPGSLVSRADIAMYRAKQRGCSHLFYHPEKDGETADRLHLSHRLRQALDGGEFILVYQPKLLLQQRVVFGVEALLRWQHPHHGLIQPCAFIGTAEHMGMISPITEWVITRSLQQHREWADQGVELPVAVNVSARSLNVELINTIERQLAVSNLPPRALKIEITENALIGDSAVARNTIENLSALGIGIAIDDFGTGYSSLAYLKTLPVETLKIDKSFVHTIAENDRDAVIVRSVIDLAHNLGFNVIAEGVEHPESLSVLDALRCDAVQGYHISEPLEPRQLIDWFTQTHWHAPNQHH